MTFEATNNADALVLDFGSVVTLTMFETHRLSEKEMGLPEGSLTWMGPFDPQGDVLWASMQRDEITERDYWLTRAKEVGKMLGEEWSQMSQFVIRARGNNPMAIVRPELPMLVKAVKAANKKLAILSNELDLFFGADLRKKITFLEEFDVITDATYTKVLKPAAQAYQLCLNELELQPDQCVFIDDQIRNVKGANLVGMRGLHLDVQNAQDVFNLSLKELGIKKRFINPETPELIDIEV